MNAGRRPVWPVIPNPARAARATSPTAALDWLSVGNQQAQRVNPAACPPSRFGPPDDAVAASVELSNIAVLSGIVRVPAPGQVDGAVAVENTISEYGR